MRCPQCNGTGIFMNLECFVCDGSGEVDPNAS